MVTMTFTYYAKQLKDGSHKVNLYIKQLEPTWTDKIGSERHAEIDAANVVRDIIGDNAKHGDDSMLKSGEPKKGMFPVFAFAIGITWNRGAQIAHYSRVCHQRYEWDAKWNPVASLGMEQYEYTMAILRKREKNALKEIAERRAKAMAERNKAESK